MGNNRSKRKKPPYKFPPTLHPTGQYCKKIRGKLYNNNLFKHNPSRKTCLETGEGHYETV
jgi:hypothetical protein